MRISMLFLFIGIFRAVGATCPCEGITLDGSDQEHCWQVESRTGSTWGAGDDSCVAVGGHLGHPSSSNLDSIVSFVQKESSLPVLTGIVAGNTEIPVIGAMCQDNGFYSVIANITGLIGNAPTSNTTCTYIKSTSNDLVFDSCSIAANVLCDRPLEKQDYCSIMANCSSTTTLLSTTTEMSSTTTNLSSTSPTTQSTPYSSSTTGEMSSISTMIAQSSTAGTGTTGSSGSGGSGSGTGSGVTTVATTSATCECPTNGGTTTTTTAAAPAGGSCTEQTGCLKHQWKILGMCVDWRAMLALMGILLGIFLCCCICHCCMHACMFCSPRKKEQVRSECSITLSFFIVRDPILPNRPLVAPVPLPIPSSKMDYDVEKSDVVVLPPPAVQPEPVFITVPEKHESVYGFHTKEIIHMLPEKPDTKDVGTMTDLTDGELPAFMPVPVNAPMMKRKKAVKKPKKMFIPATTDPIEEDVAAEIPIEVPDSPGARSVAPLGDVADPVPMVPLNFSRNPKPFMPEPKPQDDVSLPRQNQSSNAAPLPAQQRKPNVPSDNEEFDPSGLRSPPIPPAGKANAAPRRMTFSPIADESEEETGARIPSPPREPKGGRPGNRGNNGSGLSPNSGSSEENRPTLKNQRLNEMSSPTPAANAPAPAKSPSSSSGASNNPFANLGGGSPASGGDGGDGGRIPGEDVGMRAARGKLGGAVRGGGGGGEAPSGWKPWAKGGARR